MAIYKRGRGFKVRNNQEQIEQVTRARLEPGTAGLRVRSADLSAMLLTFDLFFFLKRRRGIIGRGRDLSLQLN